MEAGGERSSSIDLSDAPASDIERPGTHPTEIHGPSTSTSNVQYPTSDAYRNSSAGSAANAAAQGARQEPLKQRKPRKPREVPSAPDASKSKPQRKPRATPVATSRRKPKTETHEIQPPIQNIPPATDLQSSRLIEPYSFPAQPNPLPRYDEAAKYTQNGFLKPDTPMQHSHPPPSPYAPNQTSPPQPQPNPARSSAIYDPVRSITNPRPSEPTQPSVSAQPSVASTSLATPPRPSSRPGASPIANLIDGPMPSYPPAPSPLKTYVTPPDQQSQPAIPAQPTSQPTLAAPMDVDSSGRADTNMSKSFVIKNPASETPTRASSPKPARAKEQPPPIPTGSGLLSASLFGGEIGVDTNKEATANGPNIVLHIDLKNPKNKVINFARLAEEKYGFDALYPRQAAQRKRLNEIAARGAALERSASGSKFGGTSAGESGEDDVSVDIDRDSDNDGDVNMSGINGADQANSGTDGPEPKRRRRRKVEDYDQEDPFIDDTEQIWEQQAAASKDGFFVYCGPLVPEGEKPAVERADGTVKRGRGRGRGGGPGSRGGRGGRGGAAAAAHTIGEGDTARPASGPGSRGGTVTRKPRMRKADRLQMETEKANREKNALLASKPMVQAT